MDNPFSQPKLIYKLNFNTFYKYTISFEKFFPEEEILGISAFEVSSKTIEAQGNDIWRMEVYFPNSLNEKKFSAALKDFAKENQLEIIGKINFEMIEDKDWVLEYQKQLVPINIGNFFISSKDQSDQCPASSVPIILEASRAFGTGDHATTAGCLEAMEKLANHNFANIYDIGTGSGVLSFAAAKLWPEAKILACDIEEISVEVAKFNQQFNESKIHFYQNSSDDLEIPPEYDSRFDLIISNILAQPLIQLAPTIGYLLHKNSKLILSGFLDYQMDEVISAYLKVGLEVENIINKKEWVILTFISKK